jgi:hypothetical protein
LKREPVVFILFLSLLCLLSCGLEDVPYIDYISESDMTDNTAARIRLPSNTDEGYSNYFTRFEIYYRIYISGNALSGEINTSTLRKEVNSSLDSDFQGLYELTNKTNTSIIPSNLDTTFNNRRYFKLTLEEDNIDNVLNNGSLGQTMDIKFSPINGERPVLTLNSSSYTLRRAVSGPSLNFNPKPEDRYFLNHQDLYNTVNATNDINADVAANTQTSPELRYTYASMYIFAIGRDYLTTIYSQPTHIGIFRLAEAF